MEKMPEIKLGKNPVEHIREMLDENPMFRTVAYFSMEIGLRADIPTYAGGLGILAGDILKSAADLGVPMIGVTLMYRKGYFKQSLDSNGWQSENPKEWDPASKMTLLPDEIILTLENRKVKVRVWSYEIKGSSGFCVPVYFLDTDFEGNAEEDRQLTWYLYGGDQKYRLSQEILLGLGGVRIIRGLGYDNIRKFHLNEGHAAFLVLEMLREEGFENFEKIRQRGIFTTHTPVAAGHDYFSYDLVQRVMSINIVNQLKKMLSPEGVSMTELGMRYCSYVNAVSRKHGDVSRKMFGKTDIDNVTNGIHHPTWISPFIKNVFDRNIPGWTDFPERLVQAINIPPKEIWEAHQKSKQSLLDFVRKQTGATMDPEILTIGFARRATEYKRATLILSDPQKLQEIAGGKLQLIFAGKAHPRDNTGKTLIQRIWEKVRDHSSKISVTFIEDYDMDKASYLVQGVDLWLNTPRRPREASGTSGMKCALNGIPNFSILDGWWIEGCVEDVTGWAIGPASTEEQLVNYDETLDAKDLYEKLKGKVLPTYYENRDKWINMMINSIALNASYFNTHRVVREYCEKAYNLNWRGF
ncbi:MAG: alpha-glucan family phosphorylase [Synergistales bacterium]|nr:alpha-glucan family phosphorylase [Synergistales bacterium]